MIISKTPFRISFLGGGTDYPGYFEQHGGCTLSTTIDQYCYLAVHRLSPLYKHNFSASYSKTENVLNPADFEHPLIRETLLHMDIREGIEIDHIADLPGRTGLGSSSSFTVGLLNVLYAFNRISASAEDLAREAIHIERERVGDTGGWQDQYAAAYGGFLRLDYGPDKCVSVRHVPLRKERILQLQNRLLLFYTGIESSAENILQEQCRRTAANKEGLHELRELVAQAESLLASSESLDAFGRLLDRAWEIKKTLAGGITNPTINEAYTTALKAGADGGKLLGAGGRGFLLISADPSRQDAVVDALQPLIPMRVGFSHQGSQIIHQS